MLKLVKKAWNGLAFICIIYKICYKLPTLLESSLYKNYSTVDIKKSTYLPQLPVSQESIVMVTALVKVLDAQV